MGTPQRPRRPSPRSAHACAAVAALLCLSACAVEPGTMAMFEARNADMQADYDYACVRSTGA